MNEQRNMIDEQKLYAWFSKNNLVKSFSPRMGMLLIEISNEIDSKLKSLKDPQLNTLLSGYKNALRLVCNIAAIQQKALIDILEHYVKKQKV